MKTWIATLLAVLCCTPASASSWLARTDSPAADSELGTTVRGAFRPAFRAVEAVSDEVYDFMRSRVAGALLPSRLSRGMARAPREDSFARFTRHLNRREDRYLERARQAYPIQSPTGGRVDQGRLDQWRAWALEQQKTVVLGALEQTLFERYAMDRFAKDSGDYALKPGNWDGGFLVTAGIIGGALIYADGLHADATMRDWRVAVDLRSGDKLRKVIESGDEAHSLAALEVGRRDSPWSASAEWGAREGALLAERFGVNYRLRF